MSGAKVVTFSTITNSFQLKKQIKSEFERLSLKNRTFEGLQ